jgi:hypothetical protein
MGDPIPFDIFQRMLADTPLMGGPPGLDNRHNYDPWLFFSMCVHDAAGGQEGEYLQAWLEWCAGDGDYNDDSTWAENEYKWLHSFQVKKDGASIGSWLKLLQHLGKNEYAAELDARRGEDAMRDDPTEPETEKEAQAAANERKRRARAAADKAAGIVRRPIRHRKQVRAI